MGVNTKDKLDMAVASWLPCGRSGKWEVARDDGVTKLFRHSDPTECWMADDESEQAANRPFVEQAEGRVLITGLGLGMLPYALFCKDRVHSIDILERDHDVITLVWRHLRARWPVRCAQDRLNLIVGNAYDTEWARGRKWDWAWHDFTYSPMTADEQADIYRAYAPFVKHQMHWKGPQ